MTATHSGPRNGERRSDGAGPPAGAVVAAGAGPLPTLAQVIADAQRYLAQARRVLREPFDAASVPPDMFDPGFVHIRLMSARADVQSALDMLDQVTGAGLPPVETSSFPLLCDDDYDPDPYPYPPVESSSFRLPRDVRHEPDPPHRPRPSPGHTCGCAMCSPRVSG